MTQDERDQLHGRNGRKLDEAKRRLSDLLVRAREVAEILIAVAGRLRDNPASLRSVISTNPSFPSPLEGISAAELRDAVNIETLNELADEITIAQQTVDELMKRADMLR